VPRARTQRRLAAILAADVAGYSRMLSADEDGTLARFTACMAALASKARKHGGRVVKTMGDGALVEFSSAVDALRCAVEFQRAMAERNAAAGAQPRMDFRIGVNAGDAVQRDGDVFGDAVVLAARLQGLARPGGVCVSARVREDAQGRMRVAFEDMGEQRLKNIDRPVRVFSVRLDAAAASAQPGAQDKPSIAVLPFENLSGDPDQEYFADGLSEDIISALSRWRWFFVIARNSSFTYKGHAVDVTQVGRELGVRYLLEGSVRRSGGRMRVVAQLIDALTGAHIWSETFDRDVADLFALHDEITEHVVAAVEPAMLESEGARVAKRSVKDLSAFDCFQRGMWRLNQVSATASREAETLFREAIRRDPDLSLAYTGLARILYGAAVYGWSDDSERDLKAAEDAARAAIKLDARDAWAHFALSGALLYLGRHAEALDEAARTIALNPNFAFGHFRLGQVLIYCGRAAEAVAPIERSIAHSPFDHQMGAMRATLALAHFHAGAFEAAVPPALEAAHLGDARAPAIMAASLVRLGRHDEARAAFSSDVQARASRALRRLIPYARPSDLQDLLEALRLAGLEAPFAARLEAALPARG
jgi:adenylate cyclase